MKITLRKVRNYKIFVTVYGCLSQKWLILGKIGTIKRTASSIFFLQCREAHFVLSAHGTYGSNVLRFTNQMSKSER